MVLCCGKRMRFPSVAELRASSEIRCRCCAELIRVVTGTLTDTTGVLAAITESQTNGVVGLARLNPRGTFDFASIQLNFHPRNHQPIVFSITDVQSQILCRFV